MINIWRSQLVMHHGQWVLPWLVSMKDQEDQKFSVLKLHVRIFFYLKDVIMRIDILNDETQRKYLQAIKRLMTVAQKLHPADYARNVNM